MRKTRVTTLLISPSWSHQHPALVQSTTTTRLWKSDFLRTGTVSRMSSLWKPFRPTLGSQKLFNWNYPWIQIMSHQCRVVQVGVVASDLRRRASRRLPPPSRQCHLFGQYDSKKHAKMSIMALHSGAHEHDRPFASSFVILSMGCDGM